MRFPIILNFDSKIIYIILVSITVTIIFKYDKQYKKNFFQEIASLTSITISIICLYIRKKKSNFKENREPEIVFKKKETEKGFIIYNSNFKNLESEENESEEEEDSTIDPCLKEDHYMIILIYLLFNIIPFFNSSQIFQMKIYSFLSNTILIGIILVICYNNVNLYSHQYFSVIILFSSMLFYSFFIKEEINFVNILISIIYYILTGLLFGYLKYTMEIKFIDPFFIVIIYSTCFMLKNFLVYIYKKNQNHIFDFDIQMLKELTFYWYFLSLTFHPILNILIGYYYTPYHQTFCEILGNFIYLFLKNEDQSIRNIQIIIGIINLFFSLVASEIVILRFCGLDINTKKEIHERAKNIEITDSINVTDDSEYIDYFL